MGRPGKRTVATVLVSFLVVLVVWAGWNLVRNLQLEREAGEVMMRIYVTTESIVEGTDGNLVLAEGGLSEGTLQAKDVPDGAIQTVFELERFVVGKVAVQSIPAESILTVHQWAAPAPPGANAELDGLWMECADEDFESCDLLWLIGGSETRDRTEYEQFGGTCGRRAEYARDFCIDTYGTGPDVERWYTECKDGDFGACDLLSTGLHMTTFDPEDELFQFGVTCGGRIEFEYREFDENDSVCVTQFGTVSAP